MSPAPAPKPLWPVATLLALTGLNLFNYLDRYLLPAMLSPIEKEFGLNDDEFATVVTAFMWGYFLTSPFFGWLGDRLPRKWLVAGGVLVWSLGTALSGTAHTVASLIFFRVLVGLGEASYGTISPGWIADLWPPARRNLALSIFYVATPVGSALGFILGGVLAASVGWRHAFFYAGAPGLVLALIVLGLPEPARGASEETPAPPAPAPVAGLKVYARLLSFPAYLLVVAGYVAQTFALGGFASFAVAFLERRHGMDYAAADKFFGTSLVITGLLATLLGGVAATAWQKRSRAGYAWVLGLSAAAAVPVTFAAFLVADSALARGALVAAMFFLFFSTGPVNTLILETVPVAMRACAMAGSIFAIHAFGDLLSPKLVGKLSVRLGSLEHAVLVLPCALVVCAAFWLWLALRTQSAPRAPAV